MVALGGGHCASSQLVDLAHYLDAGADQGRVERCGELAGAVLALLTAAGFCDRRSSLAAVGHTWWHGGPGSSGPAVLLVRYFCGELACLAGTAMSGAVTWNTSSANFRWAASSCSAKL